MKLTSLSASKLNTYLECPFKYKLRYHDGIKPTKTTGAAEYGSWLHRGFELAVRDNRDVKEVLKEEVENYSFPNSYLKTLPILLRNFHKVNGQLERGTTETEFSIQEDTSVPLNGIIDRLIVKDDKAFVLDYKTGKFQKSRNSLKRDTQMLMYCYATSKLVNIEYDRIHLALFYVQTGDLVDVQFSNNDINSFLTSINRLSEEILQVPPEKAKPKINKWCSSCPFDSKCTTYQRYKALRNNK